LRGLDTNLLVRFLMRDAPGQSEVVKDLFARAEAENERLHVSTIVLCELVWVLRSSFRLSREDICSVLDSLLSVALLQFQDRDLARSALEEFRTGPADFSDYLIGWQDRRAGCEQTLTFDGGLKDHPAFTVLS
jgi:predicted nucleic-acid-binding protein